jgi:hypothetical protein
VSFRHDVALCPVSGVAGAPRIVMDARPQVPESVPGRTDHTGRILVLNVTKPCWKILNIAVIHINIHTHTCTHNNKYDANMYFVLHQLIPAYEQLHHSKLLNWTSDTVCLKNTITVQIVNSESIAN